MERIYKYNSLHNEQSVSQKGHRQDLSELWLGHSPTVTYFRIFGSKYYIKRGDDIGKFDARSDEGIFLGYSLKIKAYQCVNLRTKTIVESENVRVDDKFRIQERIVDYNLDDDFVTMPRDDDIFLETKNDF